MKIRGLVFIAIAVAFPLIWFYPAAVTGKTTPHVSQYIGSVSLILMGIAQFQATRIKGVEALFGSMDRVYVLHKWLAVAAVVLAYIHGEILDADAGGIEGRLADTAEDIGELALNGLLFLVIVSLITIIPYKYWKWSHRLIGFVFGMAAFHYVYIQKPFQVMDPQGLYIFAFCLLGIVSYIYLLLPRMLGINTRKYQVTAVKQQGPNTEIRLKPDRTGIRHQAGQFTFVNFGPIMLRETHPFTISSAPNDQGELTFWVKGLGSYTRRLGHALESGTAAWVSQPFGHFIRPKTDTPQVWIGAGIGITPFIAWAQTLDKGLKAPTQLYYCVPARDQALYLAEFEALAAELDRFEFTLVVSKIDKRLTAEQIASAIDGDIKTADVYFCGPTPMRESLRAGLLSRGLPRGHFHYEEFEIRDGIGALKFGRRLLARLSG